MAAMLYTMFPNDAEGNLARRHAFLVSTETLAIVAKKIGIENDLHHGHMTGGKIWVSTDELKQELLLILDNNDIPFFIF